MNVIAIRDRIQTEIFDYQTLTEAMNGLSSPRDKITDMFEVFFQLAPYGGMPLVNKALEVYKEVLKGRVLYDDDTPFLYDKAYETVKEFESFKPRYYDYLGIEPLA